MANKPYNVFNDVNSQVNVYEPPVNLSQMTVGNTTSLSQVSIRRSTEIRDCFLLTHDMTFHPTGIRMEAHYIMASLVTAEAGKPAATADAGYYHTLYIRPIDLLHPKPVDWWVNGWQSLPPNIQLATQLVADGRAKQRWNAEVDPNVDRHVMKGSMLLSSSPDSVGTTSTISVTTTSTLGTSVGVFAKSLDLSASYSIADNLTVSVPPIIISKYSNTQRAMWAFELTSETSKTTTFEPVVQYLIQTPDDGKGERSLTSKDGAEVLLEVLTVSLESPTFGSDGDGKFNAFPIRVSCRYIKLRRPPLPPPAA